MRWHIYKLNRCLENIFIQAHSCCIHLNSASPLFRTYKLDVSKIPVLRDEQLEERFVRGSGPGGQSVNKTSNCVVLIHKTMGITVKCHETRSLEQNRKRARELMIEKLDDKINGEDSIRNQKKRIDEQKTRTYEFKRQKLLELKEHWRNEQE